MNYIIDGIVSIILGVFIIPKIRDLYIERNKPLEIEPTNKEIAFSVNGNNWNEEFYIYLINHSKNAYYDINVVSEFPKGLNVSILPEKSDIVSLGIRENRISMGVDFMLELEDIKKGIGIAQTVINNIDPNEIKKIKVSIKKNDYKKSKNFNLKFTLGNFSKVPKPVLNRS